MLIKGQTTEQRIAGIADRFSQGLSGYAKSLNDTASLQREQNRYDDQRNLQEEALKRQEALKALEASMTLTEKTGKIVTPDMISPMLKAGDYTGLGEILKTAPATPKATQAAEDRILEREYKQSQINKNNSAAKNTSAKPAPLPLENKTVIQALAKKNADADYIANSLESFLEQAKTYDNNQLLTQGRQLIKTMNSTLGPDATGAEEVKRLGSKLEFALGNLTNDNPTQWGRDLEGFKQQVKDTAAIMRGAIGKNKDQIERQYGRDTVRSQQAAPAGVRPDHVNAIKQMSDEELLRFVQGG